MIGSPRFGRAMRPFDGDPKGGAPRRVHPRTPLHLLDQCESGAGTSVEDGEAVAPVAGSATIAASSKGRVAS